MSQTAAYLVDHVIPNVPVRQWVLSLPITPVLQEVQRVLTRNLLHRAGLADDEGRSARSR